MKNSKLQIVFCTCKNNQEAKKLANALLKAKLVACVNIINNITSIYIWNKKLEQSKEVLMIIKTSSVNFLKVERIIKKLHSYEVPEILALESKKVNKEYLNWIYTVLKK